MPPRPQSGIKWRRHRGMRTHSSLLGWRTQMVKVYRRMLPRPQSGCRRPQRREMPAYKPCSRRCTTTVPKNAAKAIEWYQKAAAQGHAEAQFSLGLMHANGKEVPKNAAQAIEWWQKAAAQGHVGAQQNLTVMYFNIGLTYLKGEGVPKDAAKALEWFQKAAAQGHAGAQKNLDRKSTR